MGARLALFLLAGLSGIAAAAEPPSHPGIDAPALAALGEFAVGVRTLTLVQRDQPDLAAAFSGGAAATKDRTLVVDLWYPAVRAARAPPETYRGELTGEAGTGPVKFSFPGLAYRDAPPRDARFPLVIVSHGLGNHPAAMTWLTENLASKGYVVAAIHHDDPPYGSKEAFPVSALRRPTDIAFVTQSLQAQLGADGLVDPAQVALVGYSMGGYGVLAVAGAPLDPAVAAQLVPGNLLVPYARGGAKEKDIRISGLRAVVAMAPAGGYRRTVFDAAGFAAVKAPLFLIVGDDDRSVGYSPGVRSIFEATTGSDRYLLTFKTAGHTIGLNPAPPEMRSALWDLDWFEDPVWRKDRIIAINLHFITAFLDGILRHDESHRSYLDVPQPDSGQGTWPAPGPAHWSDYSPGTGANTVWKGFQNRHVTGLELLHRTPAP